MHYIKVFIFLFFFICITNISLAVPLNGGFEEDFEGGEIPEDWTVIDNNEDSTVWLETEWMYAHSGNYIASVYRGFPNDDWLITPPLFVDSSLYGIQFWGRSSDSYNLEDFNVLVSTTGTDIEDFTIILDEVIEAPAYWKKYSYALGDYINDTIFVAIQCVSYDKYLCCVDDFKEISTVPPSMPTNPQPADSAKNISVTPVLRWDCYNAQNYDVYLNDELIAENIQTQNYQIDNPLGGLTDNEWYIVATNKWGSTTGPTWSFQTEIKEVSGTINQNTTWAMGSTCLITDDLTIGSYATLTIQPGVEVQFQNLDDNLIINGTLHAVGTETDSIIFTSDDSIKVAPQWGKIIFEEANDNSILKYCDIGYGGYSQYGDEVMIGLEDSDISISYCKIHHVEPDDPYSSAFGIGVGFESSPEIHHNQFFDIGTHDIRIYFSQYNLPITYSNTLSSKGISATGSIHNAVTLSDTLITTGRLDVEWDGHLTISPGVTLKFKNSTSDLTVYNYSSSNAILTAQGTEENPIIFTSDNENKTPGQWEGITFENCSSNSILEHCDIGYCNQITIKNCHPTISNCIIHDNQNYGVHIKNSSANITNNNFYGNTYDFYIDYRAHKPTLNNNIRNGLIELGGVLETDLILQDPEYAINNLEINYNGSLTIPGNTTIKFLNENSYLKVYGGTLITDAESWREKIVFTSDETEKEPGQWDRIELYNVFVAEFNFCDIEYGGSNTEMIDIYKNEQSFNFCHIRHSASKGIYSYCSDSLYINACEIYGNNDLGLYHIGNWSCADTIDARNVWWGDESGPYHPDFNPDGLGNAVSDNVLFEPWSESKLITTKPTFLSVPDSIAVVNEEYQYIIETDAFPDPYYSIIIEPDNSDATIVSGDSGDTLKWTPNESHIGDNTFIIQASNFAGYANQNFTVRTLLSFVDIRPDSVYFTGGSDSTTTYIKTDIIAQNTPADSALMNLYVDFMIKDLSENTDWTKVGSSKLLDLAGDTEEQTVTVVSDEHEIISNHFYKVKIIVDAENELEEVLEDNNIIYTEFGKFGFSIDGIDVDVDGYRNDDHKIGRYIPGIDIENRITVDVNDPGGIITELKCICGQGEFIDDTPEDGWFFDLNMGDFSEDDVLKFYAVDIWNNLSEPYTVDVDVETREWLAKLLEGLNVNPNKINLNQITIVISPNVLNELFGSSSLPGSVPRLGGSVGAQPDIEMTLVLPLNENYGGEISGSVGADFSVSGKPTEIGTSLTLGGQFNSQLEIENYFGSIDVNLDLFSLSPVTIATFPLAAGPGAIDVVLEVGCDFGVSGDLFVVLDGEMNYGKKDDEPSHVSITPSATLTVFAGIEAVKGLAKAGLVAEPSAYLTFSKEWWDEYNNGDIQRIDKNSLTLGMSIDASILVSALYGFASYTVGTVNLGQCECEKVFGEEGVDCDCSWIWEGRSELVGEITEARNLPNILAVPSMDTDGQANVFVAFVKDVDSNPDVVNPEIYYFVRDSLNNMTEPAQITDNNYVENDPAFKYSPDETTGMILWTQNSLTRDTAEEITYENVLSHQDIYYAIWDGDNFSESAELIVDPVDNPTGDGVPSLDYINQNDVLACWIRAVGDSASDREDWEIWHSKYENNSWSEAASLPDQANTCNYSVEVACDPNSEDAMAVWCRDIDANIYTPEDNNIYYSTWDGSWSTPQIVYSNEFDDKDPTLSYLSDGRVVACWITKHEFPDSTFQDEVMISVWNDGNWSTETAVADSYFVEDLSITVNSEDVAIITFRKYAKENYTGEIFSIVRDFSQTEVWTSPRRLTYDNFSNLMPLSRIDANNNAVFLSQFHDFKDTTGMFRGDTYSGLRMISKGMDGSREFNEGMNFGYNPIAPDLKMKDEWITLSDSLPSTGDTLQILVEIRNVGFYESDSTQLWLYDSHPDSTNAQVLDSVFVQSLSPDSIFVAQIQRIITEEDTAFYFMVNPEQNQTEQTLVNNIAKSTIQLVPDLSVIDVDFSKTNPVPGEEIMISCTVKNMSGKSIHNVQVECTEIVNDTSTVEIYSPDIIDTLQVGETAQSFFAYEAEEGTHVFRLTVNPDKQIHESDYENNSKDKFLYVLPDLHIDENDLIITNIDSTETKIEFPIKNTGSTVAKSINIELFEGNPMLNGIKKDSLVVDTLDVNQEKNIEFTFTGNSGIHSLHLWVNRDHSFEESDYTNNWLQFPIFQFEGADISVDSVTVDTLLPAIGDSVQFSIFVKNRSNFSVQSIPVGFYRIGEVGDEHTIKTIMIDTLNTNEGKTIIMVVELPIDISGITQFRAKANANRQIPEKNWENNSENIYLNIDGEFFAPTITSQPDTTAVIGEIYTYQIEADGFPIPTYSLITAPEGMDVNDEGLLEWAYPTEGDSTVSIKAENREGFDVQNYFVHVLVINRYDINLDGRIDMLDIQILAAHYGVTSDDNAYQSTWDYNKNQEIDLFDLNTLINKWKEEEMRSKSRKIPGNRRRELFKK